MTLRAVALAVALVLSGCGAPRDSATAEPATAEPANAQAANAQPAVPPAAARCVPVAGCNLFVGCARVGERIERYTEHPSLEGQPADVREVCWTHEGERGCASALVSNLPCTPTPSEQLALSYSCAMERDRCLAHGPRLVTEVSDQRVSITVVNEMPRTLRVRPELRVERFDGRWVPEDGIASLRLIGDCAELAAPSDDCIEIAPGARFESEPWSGMLGDAQCACDECYPAPAGRYRISAERCGAFPALTSEVVLPAR